MPPIDDANKPPSANNEGGLDPNRVEKKIGADPAIVGSDAAAGETASGIFRTDVHSYHIPESGREARERIFNFRSEVTAGEGVAVARPATHNIDGTRVKGLETTTSEGSTLFHAPSGARSWTVNNDGTYTPLNAGERGNLTTRLGGRSDVLTTTTLVPGAEPAVAAPPVRLEGVPRALTRSEEVRSFVAQHNVSGEPVVGNNGVVTFNGANGAVLTYDSSAKKMTLSAGADQPVGVIQNGQYRVEPVAATTLVAPVPTGETGGRIPPGGQARVEPAVVNPIVLPKPGEAVVVPKPNDGVVPRAADTVQHNPVVNGIIEAYGAKAYDVRTGVLTMPDGSQTQLPRELRHQFQQVNNHYQQHPEQFTAGRQGDVRNFIDTLRQQQPHLPGRPEGQPELRPQDIARLQAQMDGQPGRDQLAQAQRLQQLQLDMQNPQLRQQMLDTMRQLQAGRIDGLGPNGQRMQDIFKELGLDKNAALRQMLENPQGQLRFDRLDQLTQMKLANMVDLMQGKDIRLPGGIVDGGIPKTAIDRLQDFLKLHERVLDKVPTGESGKAFFVELNKILKDVNLQLGLEPGRGLTIADIMGRRMQDGRLAAELGLLPGQLGVMRPELRGQNLSESFAIKLTPGEQMTVRMMQLQQELAAKTLNPAIRADNIALSSQMTMRPLDAVIQGARLDAGVINNSAAMAMNQIVRDMGMRDAAMTAGNLAGREFNASMKLDPAAIKAADAMTVRATTDAVAAAAGQMGLRVDPTVLGTKDAGLIPGQVPLEGMTTPAQTAALKALEEEAARRKKKEEEEDRLEKEQDMKDSALAAMLTAKKRQELKEKEEQEKADEKDKKEPERRTRYIVKEGDTLESIASKMLRDKRLASLIYEINKATIPVVIRKGKEVVALRPKMVIWLPTTTDIRQFRSRLVAGTSVAVDFSEGSKKLTAEEELQAKYGENWDGDKTAPGTQEGEVLEDLAADAVAGAKKRRENIEKLLGPLKSQSAEPAGRSTYVVRLGDTLKSVAMKHPLLQDIMLWKLLAEVNDITTKTDEKGQPQAILRRGTAMVLPTPEEIAAFKASHSRGAQKSSLYSSGPHEVKTKSCGGCGRATISSASICPGCFRSFDEEAKAVPNTASQSPAPDSADATTIGDSATRTVPYSGGNIPPKTAEPALSQPVSLTDDRTQVVAASPASDGAPNTQIASPPPDVVQISDSVRVSRSGAVETTGLKLRLEMRLTGTYWLPVVSYEIFEDVSLRHEYRADGSRKTVRIDLPPQAAKELAENDILSNWETYCDKFASTAR